MKSASPSFGGPSVRVDPSQPTVPDPWQAHPLGFEQLVLAYLQHPAAAESGNGQSAAQQSAPSAKAVSR